MTIELKRLRERLELYAEDGGDGAPICSTCDRVYSMDADDEPTAMCNRCAQDFVRDELPAILDELERLGKRCEELRGMAIILWRKNTQCSYCGGIWRNDAPEMHLGQCLAAPEGASE